MGWYNGLLLPIGRPAAARRAAVAAGEDHRLA